MELSFISELRPRDNYNQVYQRLVNLQKQLERKNFFDEYEKKLLQYLKGGFAIEIKEKDGCFIPHQAVIREASETTKFRIVMDATFSSPSINDFCVIRRCK